MAMGFQEDEFFRLVRVVHGSIRGKSAEEIDVDVADGCQLVSDVFADADNGGMFQRLSQDQRFLEILHGDEQGLALVMVTLFVTMVRKKTDLVDDSEFVFKHIGVGIVGAFLGKCKLAERVLRDCISSETGGIHSRWMKSVLEMDCTLQHTVLLGVLMETCSEDVDPEIVTSVANWCKDVLVSDQSVDIKQMILDGVFPSICSRFPDVFLAAGMENTAVNLVEYILENADSDVCPYAFIAGIFVALSGNELVQERLLVNVPSNSGLWFLLRAGLRDSSLQVTERSTFILEILLDICKNNDPRWSCMCEIMIALCSEELHLVNSHWPRLEELFRNYTFESSAPDFDIGWIELVYSKALDHKNFAVRKLICRTFFDMYDVYLGDTEHYMPLTVSFVVNCVLPITGVKDMFKMVIASDSTGECKSLYDIETKSIDFFKKWLAWLVKDCSHEQLHSAIQELVTALANSVQLNIASQTYLISKIMMLISEVAPKSIKLGQVEVWKEPCANIVNMDTSGFVCHRFHASARNVAVALCSLVKDDIGLDPICKILAILQVTRFPDAFACTRAMVASSEVFKEQITQGIAASFGKDGSGYFNAKRLALTWSLSDDKMLSRNLDPVVAIMQTMYSSPYVSSMLKRKVCIFINELLKLTNLGKVHTMALEQSILAPENIAETLQWCDQLLSICLPDVSSPGLLELYTTANSKHELGAHLDDSRSVSDVEFALVACSAICSSLVTKPLRDDIRSFCGTVINTCVEIIEAHQTDGKQITKALKVLAGFSNTFCAYAHTNTKLLEFTTSLVLTDVFSREKDPQFSISLMRSSCEMFRWQVTHGLVAETPEKVAFFDDEKNCLRLVESVMDGLDLCNDSMLPHLFDTLSTLLSRLDHCPNVETVQKLGCACWSAYNGSEQRHTRLHMAFTRAVFSPLFFKSKEVVEGCLLPWWERSMGESNFAVCTNALTKHCFESVFTENPDLVLEWMPQIVGLVSSIEEISTTNTTEYASDELIAAYTNEFSFVSGLMVHPRRFTFLTVLDFFNSLDNKTDVDLIQLGIKTTLEILIRNRQGETRRPVGSRCKHSQNYYMTRQLWQFMCLLCTKSEYISGDLVVQCIDTVLDLLLSLGVSASVRFEKTKAIEIICLVRPKEGLPRLMEIFSCFGNRSEALEYCLNIVLSVVIVNLRLHQPDIYACYAPSFLSMLIPVLCSPQVNCRLLSGLMFQTLCDTDTRLGGEQMDGLVKTLYVHLTVRDTTKLKAYEFIRPTLEGFNPIERSNYDYLSSAKVSAYGQIVETSLSYEIEQLVTKYVLAPMEEPTAPSVLQTHYWWSEQEAKESFRNREEGGAMQGNRQQKIDPWDQLGRAFTQLDGSNRHRATRNMYKVEQAANNTSRQRLILIASFLDEIPSIASLVRTCEIFSATKLVVEDLKVKKDKAFEAVTVSADQWINMSAVDRTSMKSYLLELKDSGYRIVGVEQVDPGAKSLYNYQFQEDGRVALLLGDEVKGLPVGILKLCDDVIHVPSQGTCPTMLSHIAGAISIWEYTRQLMY